MTFSGAQLAPHRPNVGEGVRREKRYRNQKGRFGHVRDIRFINGSRYIAHNGGAEIVTSSVGVGVRA
jgi:hypothetical protein